MEHISVQPLIGLVPGVTFNFTLGLLSANALAYLASSTLMEEKVMHIQTRCQFYKHFTHVTYSHKNFLKAA